MPDELDYRIEAANLLELGQAFAGHPFDAPAALVEDWSRGQ
ncbi:MAG: hypothetical protein R2713_18760 [Ilumatobacteraceae bacterium]